MLPLPEEVKAQIREQMDQHHMAIDSFRHDIQRLFEEVDKEHLVTLRHLFNHFANRDGSAYAAYLEGTAATTLHYRFGVCGSCGEDHTAELLKDSADSVAKAQPEVEGQLDLFDTLSPEEAFKSRCQMFDVTPIEDFVQTFDQGRVKCNGCGQVYVTLADRMIKPAGAENCPGCVHKAKWG